MRVARKSEEVHSSSVLCLRAFVTWYNDVTPHVGLAPKEAKERAEPLVYVMSCFGAALNLQLEANPNRGVV